MWEYMQIFCHVNYRIFIDCFKVNELISGTVREYISKTLTNSLNHQWFNRSIKIKWYYVHFVIFNAYFPRVCSLRVYI